MCSQIHLSILHAWPSSDRAHDKGSLQMYKAGWQWCSQANAGLGICIHAAHEHLSLPASRLVINGN